MAAVAVTPFFVTLRVPERAYLVPLRAFPAWPGTMIDAGSVDSAHLAPGVKGQSAGCRAPRVTTRWSYYDERV
ncbi:hypothetical protein H480_33233 [Amycolatopsis vancoresmycina DSM 44592]|uniref:Uncharacterized protein n=1 Tax=Amycolatopsis vancoresmycina DSM 44592 TaxID=1292037 RepID=R1HUZ3_9PSEU|nr:hypothetical protein H480_33233 [Amycolatopsis vancoresmycina DSM 44592]